MPLPAWSALAHWQCSVVTKELKLKLWLAARLWKATVEAAASESSRQCRINPEIENRHHTVREALHSCSLHRTEFRRAVCVPCWLSRLCRC